METSSPRGSRPHRVILTGSSGTLGHHVLRQLAGTKARVLAIHRREVKDPPRARNIRHEVLDFADRRALAALFARFRPTCVIHCAAEGMIFPRMAWFNLVRFNVDFTLLLFELAAACPGPCHFVHVSTGLAYRSTGRPLSEVDAMDNSHPYGASKAAADILLRSASVEFKLPLTVFRPFSFTGLKDNRTRLFPSILRGAVEQTPLPLSPGDQVRDFCSARDIAAGIVMAIDHVSEVHAPVVCNLGSGRAVSLRQLVEEVVAELKIPVELQFGARPYGPFEPMHLVADIEEARRRFRWRPRHRLVHAVWELAQASFPTLKLRKPAEHARGT